MAAMIELSSMMTVMTVSLSQDSDDKVIPTIYVLLQLLLMMYVSLRWVKQ
jgi:hypothetical protein